jgi:hypothetical protein
VRKPKAEKPKAVKVAAVKTNVESVKPKTDA